MRRRRDAVRGYVASRLYWDESKTLHIGCGQIKKPDAVNIDYLKSEATDYILNAMSLPFPDDSVARIEAYHMVEHIPTGACRVMFDEWLRALEPGGTLVVEVPDFDRTVEEYLRTNDPDREEVLLEYVYGNQRDQGNVHYWGWNAERLSAILEKVGFVNVTDEPPQDFHTDEAPCLRVEAESP